MFFGAPDDAQLLPGYKAGVGGGGDRPLARPAVSPKSGLNPLFSRDSLAGFPDFRLPDAAEFRRRIAEPGESCGIQLVMHIHERRCCYSFVSDPNHR